MLALTFQISHFHHFTSNVYKREPKSIWRKALSSCVYQTPSAPSERPSDSFETRGCNSKGREEGWAKRLRIQGAWLSLPSDNTATSCKARGHLPTLVHYVVWRRNPAAWTAKLAHSKIFPKLTERRKKILHFPTSDSVISRTKQWKLNRKRIS